MGGRFSHVHYREQDAAVLPHFLILTQVWGLEEVAVLSTRLRKLSFNFCLTIDQFTDLLALRQNPLFRKLVRNWFVSFLNTKTSTVVNGLEILTALAIASVDGNLPDKVGTVFDTFDFDGSGAITLDELCILLKSVIRGLSKLTKGLGKRLVALCPMQEVEELARQCYRHCDLEEEQDLPRELFIQWVKQTPKIVNLMRCFVQREFMTKKDAVIVIQRCTRGMIGRRIAAEKRLEQQFQLEQEITQAAQKIQDAIVTRKKKRDSMQQMKIEKFSHHGALYTFGSNSRGQLGHPLLDLSRQLTAPLLSTFFKNNELRVVDVALSSVHASAVTSNGHIYTWGSGVPGSFGFIWKSTSQGSPNEDEGHIHRSGGSSATMNHIRKIPTRVEDLEDVNIVACALGNHHSVALSESGIVYTWGSGGYGQLGHGDFTADVSDIFKKQFDQHTGRDYPYVDLPLQLDNSYFEEMRVFQVTCGYYFTLALCEDGSVFSWGEGSDGQLGLGYTDRFEVGYLDEHIHGSSFVYMHTPTRIDEIKEPIGSIAVGGNHVFAVAKDHKNVYEWGAWNRRGGDAQDNAFSPQLNQELGLLYVDQIAVGKEHALAITAQVEFSLIIKKQTEEEDQTIQVFGLCARFGVQPANLSRTVTGGVYSVPSMSAISASSSAQGDRGISVALTSTIHDRSDAQIRSCLTRCIGQIVYVDRGSPTGHYISLLSYSSIRKQSLQSLLEIPCVPAAFGPELNEMGIRSKLFFSPEKLKSLQLFVRPDEIVGRIVILEFDQDDITFDSEDLELAEMINMIMISLVDKVKDAQETGAAAVVIVFDFLEADPFPLEASEDDTYEFTIPVVMVRKSHHGDLLFEYIAETSKPWGLLSYKEDILGKQILAAQKFGAKAVVVGQNRVDLNPYRLKASIFSERQDNGADYSGVKIPVLIIPYETGNEIRESLVDVDSEDTVGQIALAGFGNLYAWGFAQNGRLGLGDIENDTIFQTGFDGARHIGYQYVANPEIMPSLFDKQIIQISCGEEHSAAVTNDGRLYCWGSGRNGKLGNGSEEDEYTPFLVDSLSSVRVAKVACGVHQTFAATYNPSLAQPR